MNNRRLLILTTSFPRFADDDSAIFIKRMVEGYAELGAQGLVVVPHDSEEPIREQLGSFEVHRYKYGLFGRGTLAFGAGIMPNLRSKPLLFFQIPLFLIQMFLTAWRLREKWDCIHANWIVPGGIAWLLSKATGKPFITTLRGEDVKLLGSPVLKTLCTPAIRAATGITTVNSSFVETILALYPFCANKMKTIPNGITTKALSPEQVADFAEENELSQKLTFLFVGTVIPRKGVSTLIQFISRESLQNAQLIVCGRLAKQEHYEELQELIHELGCQSRVRFCGITPPSEIPYYMALSDFYITASEFEGRPNSVLEAMASGLVVLASDIPAHRELIRDNDTGILFTLEDLDSLDQRMRELLRFQERYTSLACAAKKEVQGFSWKGAAQSYLNIFT